MFGIENMLVRLIGDDTLLIMLAGFFLLIMLNLFTKLVLEWKRKDLRWDDLPAFIQPIVLYTVFLLGLDVLVMVGKGMPVVHQLFQGLQIIGYVSVMAKYFKRIYTNLKELGMPIDDTFDQAFEDRLGEIGFETKDRIGEIVEEYLRNKEENK